MYVLIASLDSDKKVDGIIVAARSDDSDYDISGSTFYGGIAVGAYTENGDTWSVDMTADAVTLAFNDDTVHVKHHGPWNNEEDQVAVSYTNSDGELSVADPAGGNLSGRVAPGGKFLLLHKNTVTGDSEQEAILGVFIKQ